MLYPKCCQILAHHLAVAHAPRACLRLFRTLYIYIYIYIYILILIYATPPPKTYVLLLCAPNPEQPLYLSCNPPPYTLIVQYIHIHIHIYTHTHVHTCIYLCFVFFLLFVPDPRFSIYGLCGLEKASKRSLDRFRLVGVSG